MQHMPEVYITYELPVPVVYATEAPNFVTSITIKVSYNVNWYVGLDKDVHLNGERSILPQFKSLKSVSRNMQVIRGTDGLDYNYLWIHQQINMLIGYKL